MSEPGTGDIEQQVTRLEQREERLARALELLASRDAAAGRAGRNWDAYAAVIASLIGLLALGLSGYTAYVQRQQLRAQVWPRLEIVYSTVEATLSVVNQGTGPARVTAVRVTVDGASAKNWTAVENVAGFTDEDRLLRSGLVDRVFPAGKDYVIIRPSDSDQSRAKFRTLLPGGKHAISMTICYCSVLDECWVATMDTKPATEEAIAPNACPVVAAERFRE